MTNTWGLECFCLLVVYSVSNTWLDLIFKCELVLDLMQEGLSSWYKIFRSFATNISQKNATYHFIHCMMRAFMEAADVKCFYSPSQQMVTQENRTHHLSYFNARVGSGTDAKAEAVVASYVSIHLYSKCSTRKYELSLLNARFATRKLSYFNARLGSWSEAKAEATDVTVSIYRTTNIPQENFTSHFLMVELVWPDAEAEAVDIKGPFTSTTNAAQENISYHFSMRELLLDRM